MFFSLNDLHKDFYDSIDTSSILGTLLTLVPLFIFKREKYIISIMTEVRI
jgi:hypothetical protein